MKEPAMTAFAHPLPRPPQVTHVSTSRRPLAAERAIIEREARLLGAEIADTADADQWAISVVGYPGIGDPDFDEPIPRWYLEALNPGETARYRITLVLQHEGRDLGIIRLGTLRPRGFRDADVRRARKAAQRASAILELLISARGHAHAAFPPSAA
jgi:hypothetical protein